RNPAIREYLEKIHGTATEAELLACLEGVLARDPHPDIQRVVSEAMLREGMDKEAPSRFEAVLERAKRRRREVEIQQLAKQVQINQRLGIDGPPQLDLLEKLKKLRADP